MNSLVTTSNNLDVDPNLPLPNTAFTRSGVSFCPQNDIWDWFDGPFRVFFDFKKLPLPTSIPKDSFKKTLLVFARSSAPNSLTNLFQALNHFLAKRDTAGPLISISATEVSNYSATLAHHEKWRVSTLNVLLQKWVALGLHGVDHDCTDFLRESRKPGNEKGAAVRTRDPVDGPFSEAEYTALYRAVDAAYGKGQLPLWVIVLTRLLFACGGRISQYASLKLKDFYKKENAYVLNLPQAKTREIHTRVLFKEFDLSPQTARLLLAYIEDLRFQGFDDESALFPESLVMPYGARKKRHPEGDLFFGHCLRDTLSKNFSSAVGRIAPPTDRLNFLPIPIDTQRFRYTFGTRMAEEGASKVIIADRLGHADLQNVDVYFEASPKIVENIDKAMGAALAPLSRAFMGRLVEDEAHSTQKGAPGSRIIDFRASTAPVGSCAGSGRSCAFNKPVACYTCFKFEPWLDAPHEKVLRRLEDERERFSNDQRLAAINDDAIYAVKEVIAECNAVLEQRQPESSV